MNWDIFKASLNAVGYYGTDVHGVTGATTGDWSSFVILESAEISAFTDNGATSVKIPLDTALPAGTYIGANGAFTSVTTTVGMISLSRRH